MKLDNDGNGDELITKPEQEPEVDWSGFTLHPAGFFTLKFIGFKTVKGDEKYGGKNRAELHFISDAPTEGEGSAEIRCYSAFSFDPRAKIRPFLTACGVDVDKLTKDPEAKKAFRLSSFVGKKVMAAIEHQPRQSGDGVNAVIKSFQPVQTKPKARPKFEEDDEPA